MRKSALTKPRLLFLAFNSPPAIPGPAVAPNLLVVQVLVGLGVEVHDQLPLFERVLAENLDPATLNLYDVVAGPGVAPKTRRGGGPGVHYEYVLQPPRVRHVL